MRRKVDKLAFRDYYNRSFKNAILCFLLTTECSDNYMSMIVLESSIFETDS